MPAKSQLEVCSEKILDTLKKHYLLGLKAKQYCMVANPRGTITQFASVEGLVLRTARMRLAFALQYSQADYDVFCKLRRTVEAQGKGSQKKSKGLPLQSAHITYLLTIEAAVETWNKENLENQRIARPERRKFAKRAANENLTPKQLHALIRESFGRNKIVTHGRKHAIATDIRVAVVNFIDEGKNWLIRGDRLIAKIQSEPAEPEVKIKFVRELRTELSTRQTRCEELIGRLDEIHTTGKEKRRRK